MNGLVEPTYSLVYNGVISVNSALLEVLFCICDVITYCEVKSNDRNNLLELSSVTLILVLLTYIAIYDMNSFVDLLN